MKVSNGVLSCGRSLAAHCIIVLPPFDRLVSLRIDVREEKMECRCLRKDEPAVDKEDGWKERRIQEVMHRCHITICLGEKEHRWFLN